MSDDIDGDLSTWPIDELTEYRNEVISDKTRLQNAVSELNAHHKAAKADMTLAQKQHANQQHAEAKAALLVDLGLCNDELRQVTAALAEARRRDFCLLYTSPSPRDGLLSRMPSSA